MLRKHGKDILISQFNHLFLSSPSTGNELILELNAYEIKKREEFKKRLHDMRV